MSKYKRENTAQNKYYENKKKSETDGVLKEMRRVWKWVEVKKKKEMEENVEGLKKEIATKVKEQRKVVEVVKSEEQMERLSRSLMGVSIIPIEFRKVMNLLLEECKGLGVIECRDVGPYRCLVTFSSPEIRDGAMEDQLLLSVFDEVRPHWDVFWILSRRVFGLRWYGCRCIYDESLKTLYVASSQHEIGINDECKDVQTMNEERELDDAKTGVSNHDGEMMDGDSIRQHEEGISDEGDA
ncbi:hypothetical protein PIB30_075136 [Stylosanthes scabra]|uniref:Uncharacterized protein n=1 Tax=Stylosanthes scabra TaxID=79078 RepID=A0ABU6UNQ4_9FABA|nr:hypothetical protein [Stylosanthes scabra]